MKYDIFISYRRVDSNGRTSGRDIARTIKLEFEKREYKVFFDYSEIKDNEFENVIIPAVRVSKVFIFVLTKDALLRCPNEGDWVRREIEMAIESGCKIIPVNPDNSFDGWPLNLPESLALITKQQISDISMGSLFEKSIDKIEEERILSIIHKRKEKPNKEVSKRLHIIEQKGKYGFVNAFGEEIIPCKWHKADERFIEGLVRVQDDSGRWGFVDTVGNNVINCKWIDTAKNFSEGLLCVKDSNSKWGFINKEGETVHPFVWDAAKSFYGGLAMVKGKRKRLFTKAISLWGCIDKDGENIITYKWHDCGPFFQEGLLNVKDSSNKWGFIDINENTIIPNQWDDAGIFSEEYARVAQYKYVGQYGSLKWGFIDKYEKTLIPTDYFTAYNFNNGITCAQKSIGKGWDVINNHGEILFHSNSFFPICFAENFACVYYHQSGFRLKCGFVNKEGEEVIPPTWSYARYFSSGLAPVEDDNKKWGYIDQNGKVVIPCQWEDAESFDGDFAWIKDNGKWLLINRWDY